MAYTPTEWKSGDVITAEKLNNIENGDASAGGGSISEPIITFNQEPPQMTWSCDKTFSELQNLLNSGGNIQMIPLLLESVCSCTRNQTEQL